MSTSNPSGHRPRAGVGGGLDLSAVRDVLDRLRGPVDRDGAARPKGSDVRAAVLAVLAEQPADGYRIVRLLAERGDGGRTPTAGAVYPTLQLLADEGLVTVADTDGRKIWNLTAAGHAAADAVQDRDDAWDGTADRGPERRGAIVRSVAQLAQAASLAAQTATPPQVGEIVAVLDEARRRILTILVRD